MKVIIAGSRGIVSPTMLTQFVHETGLDEIITEVVSGTARGVDLLGENWAENRDIPVKRFPANWDEYGKGAGYIRNAEMADYADALLVLWDGQSKGTQHMINIAAKKQLPIYIRIIT